MLKYLSVLLVVASLLIPQTAFAHASLVSATPEPDSQLDQSPGRIVLAFNERLENKLFYLKVLNQNGESVTANKAAMSERQTEIELSLPALKDGLYTVSYQVISADGHPVAESYVFTVGERIGAPQPSDHLNQQHEISSDIDLKQLITFVSRILYFLALLLLAGWTLRNILIPVGTQQLEQSYLNWSLNLQRLFLFSVILMIAAHLPEYLSNFVYKDIKSLFIGTFVGISWMSSLFLALFGFVVLNRSKWLDTIYVLLLLIAKSISGHAMAFQPVIRTAALDVVHLFAASIWAGGLLYIVVHWRKHKESMADFLLRFSNLALISLIVLAASGTISTMIFLPRLKYVLYTQWGLLWIAKVSLVGLVIAVGAVLRVWMRRNRRPLGMMLKADFGLMLLIVGIASIFTYLNPLPVNQPLYWHEMGETIHMTSKITPNAPGENTFSVSVWLPEGAGKPKAVRLILRYMDDKSVAPIAVPLDVDSANEALYFAEFEQYNFKAEGSYLPFAGDWTVEVRVMDAADNETVYEREIRIY
ncbi:copper resistance CopC/CopD family protein [Paenibacillus thermotolerans]|uniref:copper resistance CopC/CopD family protein n=1 Tax=Paenibacillus thermotolerans TaxID=3027807 RepID=UPI002367DC99|nr:MULTISPECIES: copper resistance protein CopC [unclassified Paenibacillus]